MPNDEEKSGSRLPVILKDVDKKFDRPVRRNDLVPIENYNAIEDCAENLVKLGTNGVGYVNEKAFPTLFQVTKAKGSYIYENQIPDKEKRNFGGENYAHSSAVVGLLDRKAQEVRQADKQALLQYARDTVIGISDSPQAQDLRRQCDAFTARALPKLKNARGIETDELTGEPLKRGSAFHHVNPKEIHTDPEDALNPNKGRNLNQDSHTEVHREKLFDETSFEAYKRKRAPT